MIAKDLAGEPYIRRQVLDARQALLLALVHRSGIAIENLNPARRAACEPAAAMQDVDPMVLDLQHQAPPRRRLERRDPNALDLWHVTSCE